MVSREGLDRAFLALLDQHYSFVFSEEYVSANSHLRFIDFLEVYAGKCKLAREVEAAT